MCPGTLVPAVAEVELVSLKRVLGAIETALGAPWMVYVCVEARPKGRPEGSLIKGYAVEDHADDELAEFETQDGAIRWAMSEGHVPHVARVRHLNDKKKPDHLRELFRP